MKHKQEWTKLVNIGERNGLIEEQIILLIALRELEDGIKGNEFNLKIAQTTSLEIQAENMSKLIKENQKYYNYYITSGNNKYLDFSEYFLQYCNIIDYSSTKTKADIKKLKDIITNVTKELDYGLNITN